MTALPVCMINAQEKQAVLPVQMEEMTSPQFAMAVEASGGVCIIPMGIIEKHSAHLPLGTDLLIARKVALMAAMKEYAVVFPPYFTGQIFEARHQPGTVAYSSELIWMMLKETCNELARNGIKKIVLYSGHGGNNSLLPYFCQAQLSETKDYIVVLFQPGTDDEADKKINSMRKVTNDGHAGEEETSMIYVIRPDLFDAKALGQESGEDQKRLDKMPNGYTGIWWYARFPNHYCGDYALPNKNLGEMLIERDAEQLAELIRYLKNSNAIEELQQEFYKRAEDPLRK